MAGAARVWDDTLGGDTLGADPPGAAGAPPPAPRVHVAVSHACGDAAAAFWMDAEEGAPAARVALGAAPAGAAGVRWRLRCSGAVRPAAHPAPGGAPPLVPRLLRRLPPTGVVRVTLEGGGGRTAAAALDLRHPERLTPALWLTVGDVARDGFAVQLRVATTPGDAHALDGRTGCAAAYRPTGAGALTLLAG